MNKNEKIASLRAALSAEVRCECFTLHACLLYVLDEHVNHEPQFLAHSQHNLTLQSGTYRIFLKKVCRLGFSLDSACSFYFSLISVCLFTTVTTAD